MMADSRVKARLGRRADAKMIRINGAQIAPRIQNRKRQQTEKENVRV